jgi:Fumarate hydratase (Fumerase)
MSTLSVRVWRGSAEGGFVTYAVPRLPAQTVLDVVSHIQARLDPTLAQGLGGDATAFAVHVELAATHITVNPVAVNMQCHSARRASAVLTADGVLHGC